jgi:dethiobiotin synthetase
VKNKRIIFVTATNTNIGKTKGCELLLKKFAKEGAKVGYFKPIETGVKDLPKDGMSMLKLVKRLNPEFYPNINDIVPFQYRLPASPFVASNYKKISINKIKKRAKFLLKYCDILVIEGAGGLMVPINHNFFMIDLIKKLQCETVLIVPSFLGSINDILLSKMALDIANINYKWYINLYKNKKEFRKITLPFLKIYFKELYYLKDI